MNKLLLVPITFAMCTLFYTVLWNGATYESELFNPNTSEGAEFNGTGAGEVDLPTEDVAIDIWTLTGAIVIVMIIMAIGIVSGLRIWSSGLADTSINILFVMSAYLGIWAALTVVSYNFISAYLVSFVLWIGLTIMYVVGVIQEYTGTGN